MTTYINVALYLRNWRDSNPQPLDPYPAYKPISIRGKLGLHYYSFWDEPRTRFVANIIVSTQFFPCGGDGARTRDPLRDRQVL